MRAMRGMRIAHHNGRELGLTSRDLSRRTRIFTYRVVELIVPRCLRREPGMLIGWA
jgi:hypothetical protein